MTVFSMKDIEKTFAFGSQKETVLKGIDLTLKTESVTALIGASGSGKSTLLTIAAGLQAPSKGTITFNGDDISSISSDGVRDIRAKAYGFIFQHAHLVPFLTVKEQLELMIDVSEKGWSKIERENKIKDVLEHVSMWQHKDSYPETLSGGEKQRTAIARAVIHEPLILFADEPTASLDSKRSVEVMSLIRRLCLERHIMVLMVTHDDDMLSYADHVIEMKDGKI